MKTKICKTCGCRYNHLLTGHNGHCDKCLVQEGATASVEASIVAEVKRRKQAGNTPSTHEQNETGSYTKFAKMAADIIAILTILGCAIMFFVGMSDDNALVMIGAVISLFSGLTFAIMLGMVSEISMKLDAKY